MSTNKLANVLIVDDDAIIRKLLSTYIRPLGHYIAEAADSDNALSVLSTEAIDVVITDVNMPGMNGVDLLKQIHAINPHMPVIMITGTTALDHAIESLNAGAFAYILKPFDEPQVLNVLNRAVQKVDENNAQRDIMDRYMALQSHFEELQTEASPAPKTLDPGLMKDLIESLLHELGNATAALKINLFMLQEQPPAGRALKRHLTDLETSANTIASILERLKQYPQRGLRLEPIDLRQTVYSSIEIGRQKYADRDIEFACVLPDDEVTVYGASFELNRALVNILENSIEALQAENPPRHGLIRANLEIRGGHAVITFSDNGPGFRSVAFEKLFSPGYTTKITGGFVRGLGLGLFIVRTITQLHGGTVTLSNAEDGGAVVEIQLPLAA